MSFRALAVGVLSAMVLAGAAPPAAAPPAYPVTPDDPLFEAQWGLVNVHAPEAWEHATGRGIRIAFVDGGIDRGHPEFQCPGKLKIIPGSNLGSKRRPDDPEETIGFHGTFVAGIAAACTDNGIGIAGVAPDATVVPIRVVTRAAQVSQDQMMAEGIRLATRSGAQVMNLALGPIPPESHLSARGFPKTEKALQEARQAGIVIAAAAGNYSQPTCEYPAFSRNVICVVATDRLDMHAAYSDFAVNADPEADPQGLMPVVAAPGGRGAPCQENVLSTVPMDGNRSCYGEGYQTAFGTSAAAPYVSGVAALLYERLGPVRSRAKADLIVETIVKTSDDLYTPGWDPFVGFGRLNAVKAVTAIEG
jgi:subtilisin family serine protease